MFFFLLSKALSNTQLCYKSSKTERACPSTVSTKNVFNEINDIIKKFKGGQNAEFTVYVREEASESATFDLTDVDKVNITFSGIENEKSKVSIQANKPLNLSFEHTECTLLNNSIENTFEANILNISNSTLISNSEIVAYNLIFIKSLINASSFKVAADIELCNNSMPCCDFKIAGTSDENKLALSETNDISLECGNGAYINYTNGKKGIIELINTKANPGRRSTPVPPYYDIILYGKTNVSAKTIRNSFGSPEFSIDCISISPQYYCEAKDSIASITFNLNNSHIESKGTYEAKRVIALDGNCSIKSAKKDLEMEYIAILSDSNLDITQESKGTLTVSLFGCMQGSSLSTQRATTIKLISVDALPNIVTSKEISKGQFTFDVEDLTVHLLYSMPFSMVFKNLKFTETSFLFYTVQYLSSYEYLAPIKVLGECTFNQKLLIIIGNDYSASLCAKLDEAITQMNMTGDIISFDGNKDSLNYIDNSLEEISEVKVIDGTTKIIFKNLMSDISPKFCIIPATEDKELCQNYNLIINEGQSINMDLYPKASSVEINVPVEINYTLDLDQINNDEITITSYSSNFILKSSSEKCIDYLTLSGTFGFSSPSGELVISGSCLEWKSGNYSENNTKVTFSYSDIYAAANILENDDIKLNSDADVYIYLDEYLDEVKYLEDGWILIMKDSGKNYTIKGLCESYTIAYTFETYQSIVTANTVKLSLYDEKITKPYFICFYVDFLKFDLSNNTNNLTDVIAYVYGSTAVVNTENKNVIVSPSPLYNSYYFSILSKSPKEMNSLPSDEKGIDYMINNNVSLALNVYYAHGKNSVTASGEELFFKSAVQMRGSITEYSNIRIKRIIMDFNSSLTIDESSIEEISFCLYPSDKNPCIIIGDNMKQNSSINISFSAADNFTKNYLMKGIVLAEISDSNPINFTFPDKMTLKDENISITFTRKDNKITVKYIPPSTKSNHNIALIAGVSAASVVLVIVIVLVIYFCCCKKNEDNAGTSKEALVL